MTSGLSPEEPCPAQSCPRGAQAGSPGPDIYSHQAQPAGPARPLPNRTFCPPLVSHRKGEQPFIGLESRWGERPAPGTEGTCFPSATVGTGFWDEDSRVPVTDPAAPRSCGRAWLSTAVKSSRQGPREPCQQVPHPLVGLHHLLGPCLPFFSVRKYCFRCTAREHRRCLLHFHVRTHSPGPATG